ncbi:RNA polymerase, sigma-24 subunit, ECF subfamily [Kribbella flavida DSM 17836]|uniref:RNA polymerase, sigma-24 subunit, ECF subfamily n=1 Tax=Kribbella flavida (strain DSM 17836 / JCM 10339 / NBRC 14399) TaxID=479435 RepID=D2PL64_KRIFD|nr:SigE family RNA polymerase sigma factor [Kribbella flavida]ADB34319.1 RNA polymerase, sigma-24 subunit, ECF subfamily [Kribbella flavida DSM 17836]
MSTDDFEKFAKARARSLYRTAWLLTGDRHHAEDLVQETLAKMYLGWRQIDNPPSYAQTVLTRTFLSQRRRRSWTERPTSTIPDRPDRVNDPELRMSMQKALAELPPLDRAVLVLRFLEDRSVEQVALDLGKSANSVKSRTMRALDRLRDVLGDQATQLTTY